MKTNWEVKKGDTLYYVDLLQTGVNVGDYVSEAGIDNATVVSDAQFLAGRFQDFVDDHFGAAVLAEVIAAVQARHAGDHVSDGLPG